MEPPRTSNHGGRDMSRWTKINAARSNLPKTGYVVAGSYRMGVWTVSSLSHGGGYPSFADSDRTHFFRMPWPKPPKRKDGKA